MNLTMSGATCRPNTNELLLQFLSCLPASSPSLPFKVISVYQPIGCALHWLPLRNCSFHTCFPLNETITTRFRLISEIYLQHSLPATIYIWVYERVCSWFYDLTRLPRIGDWKCHGGTEAWGGDGRGPQVLFVGRLPDYQLLALRIKKFDINYGY